MSTGGDDGAGAPDPDGPAEDAERAGGETAAEALARAAAHGRIALAESARAVQALLDAASLATGAEPAAAGRVLGPLSRALEALAMQLDAEADEAAPGLLGAIAEALDEEIARWEHRARDDADARAVLRAFLGLRELLWELGVRRPGEGADAAAGSARARPVRGCPGPRVQRVRVEG